MRSRLFSFGFLLICVTAISLGIIATACTAAQKAKAQSVVAATTQPTQQAIDTVASVPFFGDLAKNVLLGLLALETVAGYVIKALPTKPDSPSAPAVASGVIKPQVLPS